MTTTKLATRKSPIKVELPANSGARALVPALDRAMQILALLEAAPRRPFTVVEITQQLGIPKSSVFNICGAMVEGQLLRRSREGFQLGRKLVQLGSAYVSSVNIVGEFYDACRSVPPELGAVIQLAVIDDKFDTVYLALQDCNSGLRLGLGGGIGRRVPANCTACGKALLATLPETQLEQWLASVGQLPKLTPRSVISKAKLQQEIAEVRNQGIAHDEEGTIIGLCCVAAALPTPHVDGGFVAVSISAQRELLTTKRKLEIRQTLTHICEALRHRI
ncbi:IclR family transcriptional regulator [Dyella jejuensis]|uniref:HTH-type transcriptional repressor AllR n=1 Tax=Dyella jejuensis TaxID=1432009 RepID=A0ABW8JLI5_9GAMM